ncbi:MAG: SDR family oxidoreductase [Candidatus Poseidoniaceae archaeon]
MKSVVITGANRGIGLELTKQFLDNGSKVYATFRSDSGGLEQIDNPNLNTYQLDVRDGDLIQKLVESIDVEVDLLINNAGVADGRWQSISEIDMEYALEVINVNAISPLLVTQKFQNKMKNGSTIVMISSLMGSISDCMSGRSYAYRASKSALNMFSIAMKNELQNEGISVLILHPGWVATDMGGPNATVSPEESVRGMIERINEHDLEMSGRYVEYDGTPIEW